MEQVKISSPQNNQTTHAARAKAPAQQGVSDSGSEAGTGGFLALLAAMGDASGDAVSLTASDPALTPADLTTDVPTGVGDASAAAAWHGLFGAIANEGSAGITAGAGADLASAATLGAYRGGNGAAWDGLALDGRSQGLVAETMKLDTSVDLNDGPPVGATTGLSRAFSRIQGAQAQKAGLGGALDAASGKTAAGESPQHRFGGSAITSAVVQAMGERASLGAQHAGSAGERATGGFTIPAGAELTGAAGLAGGAVAALESGKGADSSGGSRAGDGHAGSNTGAEAGSVGVTSESGSVDGASTFSDAHPMAAEEQVAEQVAYWVNQKTQNAEMTLHKDGQPVEVSVSLSGNEAHVSFRSDQQETRALLDQSMAQLSDLLRSEGLVLSGMSVGTSGQGDSGSKGDPGASSGRNGARQAQVVSKAPAGTASLVRGVGAPDRTVDIFV